MVTLGILHFLNNFVFESNESNDITMPRTHLSHPHLVIEECSGHRSCLFTLISTEAAAVLVVAVVEGRTSKMCCKTG